MGLDSLAELALDMRWSWNHAAVEVWRHLDAGLWDLTYNPLVGLQTVSRDQFQKVMSDSITYGIGWKMMKMELLFEAGVR